MYPLRALEGLGACRSKGSSIIRRGFAVLDVNNCKSLAKTTSFLEVKSDGTHQIQRFLKGNIQKQDFEANFALQAQKGESGTKKGAKSETKGPKGEPKGSRGEPKGSQGELKGSQGEPKGSQKGAKGSSRVARMPSKIDA